MKSHGNENTSRCPRLKFAQILCFKTFRNRNYSKTDAKFLHVLQTRAWIVHSCYTIQKLSVWVLGTSLWLSLECFDDTSNLCPEYNHKILDPITLPLQVLMGASIILSVFLDIACFKFRFLAQTLLYCEITTSLIVSLIPLKSNLEAKKFFICAM